MSFSSCLTSVLKRAGLLAGLALLAGCATSTNKVVVEVTSPPNPRIGSGPIAAYDAYAAAWFSPVTSREIAAQAARSDAVTEAKGPAAAASMN